LHLQGTLGTRLEQSNYEFVPPDCFIVVGENSKLNFNSELQVPRFSTFNTFCSGSDVFEKFYHALNYG